MSNYAWYMRLGLWMKDLLRPTFYFFFHIRLRIIGKLYPSRIQDARDIPIIINSYNRYSCLLKLIEALEKRGYSNIFILDNDSTYPPLLRYYDECPYTVLKLRRNLGHLALWKSRFRNRFIYDYFVYTDPDVVPVEACPDDFLDVFWRRMQADSSVCKVGFSLRIDDLPDHYAHKEKVVEMENEYYQRPTGDGFYWANIDTTFALHRPGLRGGPNIYLKMLRSAFPYAARHTPWYEDSENPSEEELYYRRTTTTSTHWTKLHSQAN